MRLLELDIHDVRGIRDLTLGPKGENCVVVGPNGSGKSAVVDAIDFLLTGEIGRLRGRGTGGFTLEKYGPHVDSSVSKAMVRALVKLPNVPSPVEITRRMSAPNVLEYDPKWKAYLEPILVVAKRGQHVLTRREILKYITAEAGTRAEEIQDLLNLSEIENIRGALVTVSSSFEKTSAVAMRALENSRRTACHILGEKTYREERLLNLANERRALLGGHPITKLNSTELTAGLAWPGSVTQDNAVDPKSLESEIQGLLDVESSGTQEALASAERQLRERVQTIASDAVLLQALSQLHLTELGIRLLDKTGVCPLCDTPWAPGELLRHLEEKLSRAKEAQELRASIANLAGTITNAIDAATARARRVEAVARAMKREVEASKLEEWLQELQALSSSLADPIDAYPSSRFAPERVSSLLMPHGLGDGLRGLLSSAKQEFLPATPEQTAWSELTELVGSLKAVEEAAAQLSEAERDADCANRLHGNFVKARNKVLGRLYDEVSDEFVSLYRQLHYLDEGQFGAKLEPKDAGLKLDVDFYGRGKHPPHALHSEGHQDSMGLCLYLVLAERLTRGVTDLIILDDVVMSVDADHRRQLCRLLSNAFPHRQFIITTHDKNWAYELRSERVVQGGQVIEFFDWCVDTGPLVGLEMDFWDAIEKDLSRNDAPIAAARLRRGIEQFCAHVCDAVRAHVRYRINGRCELEDLLNGAWRQYKKLLSDAKDSARSWGNEARCNELETIERQANGVFARLDPEKWAVNANVHFNSWAAFGPSDFRPVVASYKAFCDLYRCGECKRPIYVTDGGSELDSVRCPCGKVNWNLTKKRKEG